MRPNHYLAFTVCLLGLCDPPRIAAAADPDDAETVRRLAQPYIDAEVLTGLSIGIVREGREPLILGLGRTGNPGRPEPDGRTVYEIGSISKVFTGILLAHAVAEDAVELRQPVAELLPGVSGILRGGDDITLLDLATHASGLPRLPSNMDPAAADPYAAYGGSKLLEYLARRDVAIEPRRKSEYSNLGFAVLGYALEQRLNSSYGQLTGERIFAPLEMRDTTTDATAIEPSRLAVPHDAGLRPTNPWTFETFAAAGAIRSTVEDMICFIEANLRPPEGKLGEAIDTAWEVHRPAGSAGEFAMGLGWHVARDGQTRWHNGGTGGYHSSLFVNRRHAAGVVVLSNTASFELDVLAEQLAVWAMGGADDAK